ncbi:MAG: LamG domain-containing protein [archaeon]
MHFNNETGENDTYVRDWSGNGNDGTVLNATQTPSANLTSGYFGQGFEFYGDNTSNGIQSVISVGDKAELEQLPLSISVWFKTYNNQIDQLILTKSRYYGSENDYGLYIGSNQMIGFFTDTCWSDEYLISINQWYHAVGIHNGSHQMLYVDGILRSNYSCSVTSLANDFDFTIGADGDDYDWGFNGTIDEVAVWNRSLNSSEVLALYNFTRTTYFPIFQNISVSDGSYMWNVLSYDDKGQWGWASNNATFTVLNNTAPSDPIAYVNSSDGSNQSNKVMNCFATVSDPESTALNVTVRWYLNGTLNLSIDHNGSYSSGSLFIGSLGYKNTTRTDNWTCDMRLFDGFNYSNWVEAGYNVTILNSPPDVPSLITLTDVNVSDSLGITCPTPDDEDGDSVTLYYQFYNMNDSQMVQSWSTDNTYVVQLNDSHDTINATCGGTDGTAFGLNISAVEVVDNAYPSISLTINTSSGLNKTSEEIRCFTILSDSDNDTMNVSVVWFLNGTTNITLDYNDSYANGTFFNTTLMPANTTPGENWSCALRVFDNNEYTAWAFSENLTIGDQSPLVTLVSPPDAAYDTDGIILLISNVTDDVGVINTTLYTNFTGTWQAEETRWNGEVAYNSTGLVLLMHFNNESLFNENSTWVFDWSGKGNNGTFRNNVNISDIGKYGTGLGIDSEGTFSYVEIPDSPSLNLSASFTISTWFKRGTIDDWENILNKDQSSSSEIWFGYDSDNCVEVKFNGCSGSCLISCLSSIDDTGWHHVVAVWNGSHVFGYADGELVAGPETESALPDSNGTINIGDTLYWSSSYGAEDSILDEAAIWNRSLSASEIVDLYNYSKTFFEPVFQEQSVSEGGIYQWNVLAYDSVGQFDWGDSNDTLTVNAKPKVTLQSPEDQSTDTDGVLTFLSNASDDRNLVNATLYTNVTGTWTATETRWNGEVAYNSSGLVLLMHFNNESQLGENSTYVYDFSDTGNNGTVNGGSLLNVSNGMFGGGIDQNNIDGSFVDCGNDVSLQLNSSFSISAWFTSGNSSDTRIIVSKTPDVTVWWNLQLTTNGLLRWQADDGDNKISFETTNVRYDNNTWYHVAIVRNISGYSMFIDGAFVMDGSNNGDINNSGNLYIGANEFNGGDYAFNGTIDEVAIWDRSLSSTEIDALYDYTKTRFQPVFQNITVSETVLDFKWNVLVHDNESLSSWGDSNYTGRVASNSNPSTPNTIINSTDATNGTSQDLNCFATISDGDSDDLNVSVVWFLNGTTNISLDYNDSYTSGDSFVATLGAGNTTITDNWSCALRLWDGYNFSSWGYSKNLTIINAVPSAPILSYPTDGDDFFINRSPDFNWTNATDADGDTLTYHIQIATNKDFSPVDIFDQRGVSDNKHPYSGELDFTTYYWRVAANDSTINGSWSSTFNFTLVKYIDITLNIGSVDFGAMDISSTDDTDDSDPAPFQLANTGNYWANVSVKSTTLWTSSLAPINSSYYQFKGNRSSEGFTFRLSDSLTTWTNMSDDYVMALSWFNYTDSADIASIDIRLTVPADEPPTAKNANITFYARESG